MRKFTHLSAKLCTLLILLSCVVINVKAATAADLFGTYTFTATVTYASDDYKTQYSDVLKSECEVTIATLTYYDFGISGIAGGDGVQGASFDGTNITIYNPSTSNYYLWSNSSLGVGSKDGAYNETLTYTYDETTGNITMPDFTAVLVTDWNSYATTIVATFTDCKLTLKSKASIEIDDLSGNWHYNTTSSPYSNNSESTFPTEFDLVLTASDDTYKTYSGVLTFEGYDPIQLTGITFDGSSFIIPVDSTYIDADKTLRLGDYNGSASSKITFNYTTGKALSLTDGITIMKKSDSGEFQTDQWYMYGSMTKASSTETTDWAGTYTINVGYAYLLKTDVTYPNTGETFDIVITRNSYNDKLYVTEFMGNDTYNLNYGGIPCEESGDTLKISTGSNRYIASRGMSDDGSVMSYDVLYDGQGTTASTVNIIRDGGTYTITDFFLERLTREYDTSTWAVKSETVEGAAFYSMLTVSNSTSGIATVAAENEGCIKVADGAIELDGTQAVTVYNAGGATVFSGVTNKVSGLGKGLYIVKAAGKAVKVLL